MIVRSFWNNSVKIGCFWTMPHKENKEMLFAMLQLSNDENVGPDVMQSGFGVNFLFWSGEFEENCR